MVYLAKFQLVLFKLQNVIKCQTDNVTSHSNEKYKAPPFKVSTSSKLTSNRTFLHYTLKVIVLVKTNLPLSLQCSFTPPFAPLLFTFHFKDFTNFDHEIVSRHLHTFTFLSKITQLQLQTDNIPKFLTCVQMKIRTYICTYIAGTVTNKNDECASYSCSLYLTIPQPHLITQSSPYRDYFKVCNCSKGSSIHCPLPSYTPAPLPPPKKRRRNESTRTWKTN